MLKLEIETGNAAFDECAEAELARILRSVADAVEAGATDGPLHDFNGNNVGRFDWEAPAEYQA